MYPDRPTRTLIRGDRFRPYWLTDFELFRSGEVSSWASSPSAYRDARRVEWRVPRGGGDGVRRRDERADVLVCGGGGGFRDPDFGVVVAAFFDDAALFVGVLLGVDSCFFIALFPLRDCLVSRRLPCGCNSIGNMLIRPDFRRPFSVYEVGPSTPIFFQGGDSGLGFLSDDGVGGGGVLLRVRCLFAGRPFCSSSWPLTSGLTSSVADACPFVCGVASSSTCAGVSDKVERSSDLSSETVTSSACEGFASGVISSTWPPAMESSLSGDAVSGIVTTWSQETQRAWTL